MVRPKNPLSARWYYHARAPKTAKPDKLADTLGSGACWCGKAYKHDWPGKADGKPHPK